MTRAKMDWYEANQQYLVRSLGPVRAMLNGVSEGGNAEEAELATMRNEMDQPPALETLCSLFGLTAFERQVLLLCAGIELDAGLAGLIPAEGGRPTFSLALEVFPGAHWSALSPSRPLRRWRLIELGREDGAVQRPLRIDERVLNYLTGIHHLDERLVGYIEWASEQSPIDLAPSQAAVAERLARTWRQAGSNGRLPVIQLVGGDSGVNRAVAIQGCGLLGLQPHIMPAQALPREAREQEALHRLWEREAVLSSGALILELEDDAEVEPAGEKAILSWIERANAPLILSGKRRRSASHRGLIPLEVRNPTRAEQHALWRSVLDRHDFSLNGAVDRVSAQFDLPASAISGIFLDVSGRLAADDTGELETLVWDACRELARPRLGELAQVIEPAATWEDIVLPESQLQVLREIAVHVRQRVRVYEEWGFAARSSRGLGISALFSGASGTGKTMAAEVLANELRLDLFRIDLSQVVSKYIGETEKNLGRVFDAAEQGGAILLFDEADALFGKRSEVKDSHDRYANIEVSYLLQRMEAYRGLAILTTNLKTALDTAFMRRIRFIVQFPFPGIPERREIWRRILPAETPTEGLDVDKLARLNVAGGNIRNIALYAAFLAAEEGAPVRMSHLERGARLEYSKLEKTLTAGEVGDWSPDVSPGHPD